MKRTHVLGSLIGLVATAGLLAGCATGTASSPSGSAPTTLGPRMSGPEANWIDSGRAIALSVVGSEYCPVQVQEVSADGQKLMVALETRRTDIGCERNQKLGVYVPLPDGVATDAPVTLSVTTDGKDQTQLTVPALPAPAAQVAPNGPTVTMLSESTLALLSWGSASCPPVVADGGAAKDAKEAGLHVTVESTTQVCADDQSARITVFDAEGVTAGDQVTVENLDGAAAPVVTTIQFPAPMAG